MTVPPARLFWLICFSRKLLPEGSCSVTWRVWQVWSLRRHAGAPLRPRFLTEKTPAKNQNVRFAWCSDFKTPAKWTKKVRHVSHDLQVFHRASCFTVFPYDFLYRVLQSFSKTRFMLFMFCEPLSSETPNCGVQVSSLFHLVYAKRYFIS